MPLPRASEGPEPAASVAAGAARPPAVRQAVALPAGTGVPSGALTPTGAQRRPAPAAAVPPVTASAPPEAERSAPEAAATAPAATAATGGRTTTEGPATAADEPSTTATATSTVGATTTAGVAAAADRPATATATATAPGGSGTGTGTDEAHAGRPKKPLLAAAAIVGSLLIALPFALSPDGDRKDSAAGLVTSATTGTVLQSGPSGRPGAFTAESPSASPSADTSPSAESVEKKPKAAPESPEPEVTKSSAAPAAAVKKKPSASPKATAGTDTKKAATGTAPKPAGRALVSAQTGKCLSAGSGKDGTQLVLWTCDGSASQRWDFRSDGTVRALNMCMDVAWASTENLTAIQVAHCSGNQAQQFRLNSTQDLVAGIAGKCVDIYMGRTANGTPAVLFPCSGDPNQTWT
ncbi:RICIN domain-containing protein [Streptomyces sp. NPDC002793]|uniref:RICIN domain-containing protein n=1 Tax=Streptomyces sp. NPDC002793 TaxID=3154432 RepID=UPI00332C5E78